MNKKKQKFFAPLFFKKAASSPGHAARNTPLDGLRGIASLIVLFSHFVIAFIPAMLDGAAAESHFSWDVALSHGAVIAAFSPNLGVGIFFVLSGYVLAASIAARPPAFLALAISRWIRLCLPVLATTLLIWAADRHGAFVNVIEASDLTYSTFLASTYPAVTAWIDLKFYVADSLFTFFRGSSGWLQNLNAAVWTMPIELLGSLGLFLGYCLAGARRLGPIIRLVCAILILVLAWHGAYYGFALGAVIFETGAIAGALRDFKRRRALLFTAGAVALLAGLWLGGTPFVLTGRHQSLMNALWHAGFALHIEDLQRAGAGCLVIAALLLPPFQRLLATATLQYLGRISFMLYLLQMPVLCSVAADVMILAAKHLPYGAAAATAFIAYLLVSLIAAELATRLIDTPCIWLSRITRQRIAAFESSRFLEKAAQKLF